MPGFLFPKFFPKKFGQKIGAGPPTGNFGNGLCTGQVGAGGGPSDFIGKDTGGGSFPEAFKSSLARDFEFHSSADGFAATRTASCRAGRRILGGIDAQHAPSGVHQHSHWPLAFQHGGANARHGQLGHPPFFPHALLVGGYWAALCSVALAEELVEWLSQKASKSTALLPPRCHAGLARR